MVSSELCPSLLRFDSHCGLAPDEYCRPSDDLVICAAGMPPPSYTSLPDVFSCSSRWQRSCCNSENLWCSSEMFFRVQLGYPLSVPYPVPRFPQWEHWGSRWLGSTWSAGFFWWPVVFLKTTYTFTIIFQLFGRWSFSFRTSLPRTRFKCKKNGDL